MKAAWSDSGHVSGLKLVTTSFRTSSGFLANRVRGELLPIVNDLLGLTRKVVTRAVSFIDLMKVNFNYDFLKCPSCGGILELTRRYFGLFGARCADEIHQKLATSGFEKN